MSNLLQSFSFLMMFSSLIPISQAQMNPAQDIVNKCISVHGGKKYQNAHFSFEFRKHHYVYHYDHGKYQYERHHEETDTRDYLTNSGFSRWQKGEEIALSAEDARKFANSVNSVHYFAFLPFFLNDAAVQKKLLGVVTIKGLSYFKIQVSFKKEGGGDDYDDTYVYWIHQKDFTLDYLAYSFHEDGGGVRFRTAYNRRTVAGVIFQDYINYKYEKDFDVVPLDELYNKGELVELSRIELKNIKKLDKKSWQIH